MSAGYQLEIEPDGMNDVGQCPHCGNPSRTVWGYVFADGNAHAVYYARWTPGHLERGAQLLLSFGEWGDGSRLETRRAVGLECRMGTDVPSFMVVDAPSLPWSDEMLGRKLSREETMSTEAASTAFAIADALWEREPRFRAFLLEG